MTQMAQLADTNTKIQTTYHSHKLIQIMQTQPQYQVIQFQRRTIKHKKIIIPTSITTYNNPTQRNNTKINQKDLTNLTNNNSFLSLKTYITVHMLGINNYYQIPNKQNWVSTIIRSQTNPQPFVIKNNLYKTDKIEKATDQQIEKINKANDKKQNRWRCLHIHT